MHTKLRDILLLVVFAEQLIFAFLFLSPLNIHANNLIPERELQALIDKHEGSTKNRLKAWKNLIEKNQKKTEAVKLKLVNDFFNQFKFISDIKFIGEPDYWMTPTEFVVFGEGDCEDFSIAKYFTLLALGLPVDKLRIMYVKALKLNQAHMVLAYYKEADDEPIILDNLIAKIQKASQRKDLLPVYSFNGESLWMNKAKERDKKIGSSSALSKWHNMLFRMEQNRKGL